MASIIHPHASCAVSLCSVCFLVHGACFSRAPKTMHLFSSHVTRLAMQYFHVNHVLISMGFVVLNNPRYKWPQGEELLNLLSAALSHALVLVCSCGAVRRGMRTSHVLHIIVVSCSRTHFLQDCHTCHVTLFLLSLLVAFLFLAGFLFRVVSMGSFSLSIRASHSMADTLFFPRVSSRQPLARSWKTSRQPFAKISKCRLARKQSLTGHASDSQMPI